jgi:hypothetical protein
MAFGSFRGGLSVGGRHAHGAIAPLRHRCLHRARIAMRQRGQFVEMVARFVVQPSG